MKDWFFKSTVYIKHGYTTALVKRWDSIQTCLS